MPTPELLHPSNPFPLAHVTILCSLVARCRRPQTSAQAPSLSLSHSPYPLCSTHTVHPCRTLLQTSAQAPSLLGTASHIAPEVMAGGGASRAADCWSFGLLSEWQSPGWGRTHGCGGCVVGGWGLGGGGRGKVAHCCGLKKDGDWFGSHDGLCYGGSHNTPPTPGG